MTATTTTAEETALRLIEIATRPTDLFPNKDSARSTYRRLARRVHPDVAPAKDKDRFTEAFEKLAKLWGEFNGVTPTPPKSFTTKRFTYFLGDRFAQGDIANLYNADAYTGPGSDMTVHAAKIVRSPVNNALIVQEAKALKRLNKDLPENLRAFYPTPVDTFKHRDLGTSKDRQSIVLEKITGGYTLRQVMERYPEGLDPRDIAWMARRLFVAIANAHEVGLSHCAVIPENVMILPEDHGVILLDWAFSRDLGQKLKVALPTYLKAGWYGDAPKYPIDHRLDVRQAAYTLEGLLGPRAFKPYNAFFKGCRVASTPQAEQLFREFDELLERLYGRRRFRPFTMEK